MATYRAIVSHVRYWRGGIHRWSTSYQYTGSLTAPLDTAAATALLNADNKMLFGTGTTAGGTYKCAIYSEATGGVPVATYTAFDWETPAAWQAGSASVWPTSANVVDPVAETALLVEWPAGLSRTGKPVNMRKWYHMVPVSTVTGGTQQVSAAQITALQGQAQQLQTVLNPTYGLALGTAGRLPGTPRVSPFYVTHQMPRGRRRNVVNAKSANANYEKVLQLLESNAYSQANSGS